MDKIEQHRIKMQRMILEYAGNPSAIYSIGAGNQLMSDWAFLAKQYPNAKLYGCEPHPATYKKIKPRFPGLLLPIALHHKSGKITLYLASSPGSSSVFHVPEVTDAGSIEVDSWTLDMFDKRVGSSNNILLWMDIEGSELAALQGGHDLMKSGRVTCINLEVRSEPCTNGWPTDWNIHVFLSLWGYRRVQKYNYQKTHYDVIYTKEL